MEGYSFFENSEIETQAADRQRAVSGLQRDLVRMSNLAAADWIERNADRFRRLIDRRPEILDHYREEPDLTAQQVRDLMFVEED